jgi:hypothetical protein
MDASADTILSKAKGLNLFEESVTDENPEVVRQGRIKTWIFLVLLPAGFIGYIIWALTSKQIIVVSAEPASYAHFRQLSAAHPDLSCACTQLSMPLTRILPPLPEQPLTVTAKVVGQMEVGNRRINFTEADSTNWTAAGFTMYDKWCSRVVFEPLDGGLCLICAGSGCTLCVIGFMDRGGVELPVEHECKAEQLEEVVSNS